MRDLQMRVNARVFLSLKEMESQSLTVVTRICFKMVMFLCVRTFPSLPSYVFFLMFCFLFFVGVSPGLLNIQTECKTAWAAGLCQIPHSILITWPSGCLCSTSVRMPLTGLNLHCRLENARETTFSVFDFQLYFLHIFQCIKYKSRLFPHARNPAADVRVSEVREWNRHQMGLKLQRYYSRRRTVIYCGAEKKTVWLNYSFKTQLLLHKHVFLLQLFKGHLT